MFVNLAVKQDVKTFMNEADKRIAERIDGIVAEMRKQIASTLFSEEVVNELSKKTLGSYVYKTREKQALNPNMSNREWNRKDQGVDRAFKKMKKEETVDEEEVNELSKKTLGSYVNKASYDAKEKEYNAGRLDGANAMRQSTGSPQKSTEKSAELSTKAYKRTKGIAKAVSKLTK